MKKLLILLIFFIFQCAICAYSFDNPQYENIDEIARILKNDSSKFIIMDVRTPEEFDEGHIEGAINLNYYDPEFEKNILNISRDNVVILYCRSGIRSAKAEKLMRKAGFENVIDLKGGINAWVTQGYPLSK